MNGMEWNLDHATIIIFSIFLLDVPMIIEQILKRCFTTIKKRIQLLSGGSNLGITLWLKGIIDRNLLCFAGLLFDGGNF